MRGLGVPCAGAPFYLAMLGCLALMACNRELVAPVPKSGGQWEEIAPYTHRLRVHDGWFVRKGHAACFVPDPAGSWELEK